jgi:hypothetical protein
MVLLIVSVVWATRLLRRLEGSSLFGRLALLVYGAALIQLSGAFIHMLATLRLGVRQVVLLLTDVAGVVIIV